MLIELIHVSLILAAGVPAPAHLKPPCRVDKDVSVEVAVVPDELSWSGSTTVTVKVTNVTSAPLTYTVGYSPLGFEVASLKGEPVYYSSSGSFALATSLKLEPKEAKASTFTWLPVESVARPPGVSEDCKLRGILSSRARVTGEESTWLAPACSEPVPVKVLRGSP